VIVSNREIVLREEELDEVRRIVEFERWRWDTASRTAHSNKFPSQVITYIDEGLSVLSRAMQALEAARKTGT
jgi:hypothetical protein